VKGIADGTLPLDRFRFYVMQDAYYLSHFAKVQAIGAVKAGDLETTKRFAHHAEQTCAAEMALHESFMEMLDVTKEDWAAFEPSPSAYAYVSHMYRSAEGDLADVLAAILPCYWLYYEIGENLKNAKPDHPIYNRWIETYGSEWFGELVTEQIERMDKLAEGLPEARHRELKDRFRRSSYYEWHFWEQAWKKETWSVETFNGAEV
jgi:thiaminase/transcriptional activator TenA